MRALLAVALFLSAAAQAGAASGTLALDADHVARLGALAVGDTLVLDDFPDGRGGTTRMGFTRIDVYARGARVLASGPEGTRELPRSARVELVGFDAGGTTRAQLAFDPGFIHVAGAGSSPAGAFAISSLADANGSRLLVVPAEDTLPAGVKPEVIAGDDALPSGAPMPDALTLALAPNMIVATPRVATIAVDVDHELLVGRFGGTGSGNLAAATNWIVDLFATMNVMYQRDLNVALELGTTIFRTGPTPYAISANAAASGTDLNNFGAYWQANHGNVARDFTMLLSGQQSNAQNPGFSASGIAWINAYCRTQSNGGSYSVNKVFTSSQVAVDLSARIVGHELGHNFGAYHTHCTNASSGAAPTASNTIDQCYSGESGCYSGAASCPASGPGAPAGTLMSYCNTRGCGPTGQNVLQFHPIQVATLLALVAQNTPSCLNPNADQIFRNGFD